MGGRFRSESAADFIGMRIPALRVSGSGGGTGTAVFGVAAVRELLSAVVQAGWKSSRWREGQQNISFAGHALSAITGRCTHQRGCPPPCNGDVCHAGSGSIAETIREVQQELVALADRPVVGDATEPSASTLEQFLSGLRTAWQDGEVRPTGKPKEKAPRGRRRPDPLARVTELLHEWFEAEPWRTSRELFERLQEAHPGLFPDGQLRTLQRRVKTWRHALAHKMVFGVATSGEMPGQASLYSPDTVGVTPVS